MSGLGPGKRPPTERPKSCHLLNKPENGIGTLVKRSSSNKKANRAYLVRLLAPH
jgi:hypothetical protein